MLLKDLYLTHFRNHTDRVFNFAPKTLIVGPNGIGKSNIIEAIRFLSIFKSFRTPKDSECIEFDQLVARAVGQIQVNSQSKILELVLADQGNLTKIVKLNEVKRPPAELIGFLPTVLFTPTDTAIVAGGPHHRRRFMDGLLIQIDQQYLWSLAQYQKVIRQRNALLKEIISHRQPIESLTVWDLPLIEYGSYLNKKRSALVQTTNEQVTDIHRTISSVDKIIRLRPKFHQPTESTLMASRDSDLRLGSTTHGPHHDDFDIIYNKRSLANYGSHGQWRSVVVALKFLEEQVIYQKINQRPLLLFDDVFSELDQVHRDSLINLSSANQIIFTTADTEHNWQKNSQVEIIELSPVKLSNHV